MTIKSSFKHGIMLRPATGEPLAIRVDLDFSSVSEIIFDLEKEQTLNYIDFVQTIYISNFNNADPLVVTLPGGQVIHVPAQAEGYYPVVAEFGKFVGKFATPAIADLIIPIVLMNVPVASQQWGPITINVDSVIATFTPTVGVFTDASGNAGASAELFAANAGAIRRIVQNPANNINSIFINFGGVAASATTFEIPPGGKFDTETGPVDQTQWTIYAAAATPFVAYQMI